MSTGMPQATMNGQQLNWGQAPAQSNGKRWGRLAVKLAVGVGVVVAAGWALSALGVIGGAATLGSIGGSALLSEVGFTEGLSDMISHIVGLGEKTSESVISHTTEAINELAGSFTQGTDGFVFSETWKDISSLVQSSIAPQLETLNATLADAANQAGTLTAEAGEALKTTIEAQSVAILDSLQQAANNGLITAEQANNLAGTFADSVQNSFDKITDGPGLLDLDASHYAMAAGGAGAALLGSKLLGGNRNTLQAANQNRVPPAPHPSHIRPNTGKFTAKYHNQDIANHLQANGFAVEGAAQQPQHRTI